MVARFSCVKKIEQFDLLFLSYFIFIHVLLRPLQQDSCKLSVLVTFSCVKEK